MTRDTSGVQHGESVPPHSSHILGQAWDYGSCRGDTMDFQKLEINIHFFNVVSTHTYLQTPDTDDFFHDDCYS